MDSELFGSFPGGAGALYVRQKTPARLDFTGPGRRIRPGSIQRKGRFLRSQVLQLNYSFNAAGGKPMVVIESFHCLPTCLSKLIAMGWGKIG